MSELGVDNLFLSGDFVYLFQKEHGQQNFARNSWGSNIPLISTNFNMLPSTQQNAQELTWCQVLGDGKENNTPM
jgi:hypothetical protein